MKRQFFNTEEQFGKYIDKIQFQIVRENNFDINIEKFAKDYFYLPISASKAFELSEDIYSDLLQELMNEVTKDDK